MVEEAYRSNAGIVGPKVVDHDHPEVLLEVGMAVDHYGVPFSGIEPDEVDQEQHDGVRDVFFVSHAAMLVRADLFHELGGFDPATFPGADDIDLCWRARLAGARVLVAPAARVAAPARHDGASSTRRPATVAAVELRARRARASACCASRTPRLALAVGAADRVRARRSGEALGLLVTGTGRAGRAPCRRLVLGVRASGRAAAGAAQPRSSCAVSTTATSAT